MRKNSLLNRKDKNENKIKTNEDIISLGNSRNKSPFILRFKDLQKNKYIEKNIIYKKPSKIKK